MLDNKVLVKCSKAVAIIDRMSKGSSYSIFGLCITKPYKNHIHIDIQGEELWSHQLRDYIVARLTDKPRNDLAIMEIELLYHTRNVTKSKRVLSDGQVVEMEYILSLHKLINKTE